MKGFTFRFLIAALIVTLFALVVLPFAPAMTPAASGPAHDSTTTTPINDLPSTAQAGISATLGKEDPSYHFQPAGGDWRATHPQQGLITQLTSTGAAISAGDAHLTLKLAGYGYGDQLNPVATTTLQINQNRAEYHHVLADSNGNKSEMVEWYLNGPFGLEQGFTLTEPSHSSDSQLTLTLAIETNLSAALEAGSTGLALARADGTVALSYSGLAALDATGQILPAHMLLGGDHETLVSILVDTTGARYPITIDPWIQKAKLTASDSADGDYFGYSVAIEGDIIVVGAECDDSDRGSAYVFVKPAGGWANMTQTAKLTASDRARGDLFGSAVGISGDIIVIAAMWDNSRQGAAYVFAKPSGGWSNMTQTAKLTASDGEIGDWFGASAAISGDTIVVGAAGHNYWQGAAYVFVKPGGGWADMTQTAKLTASDGAGGDRLGSSASISGDTIVTGAIYDDSDRGSAYVYVKPGSGWSDMIQTAKLTPLDSAPSSYYFGISAAISGDTVVVGANGVANYTGAAYVFVKPTGGWSNMTQTAKLTASDAQEGDSLGSAVAIYGNIVIAGADGGNSGKGAVYTFVRPTAGWSNMTETDRVVASDSAEGDGFGLSTAVSSSTIVAGSYAHNSYRGAIYLFGGGATAVQLSQLRGYAANSALPVGMGVVLLLVALGIVFAICTMGPFGGTIDINPTTRSQNGSLFTIRRTANDGPQRATLHHQPL